MNGDATPLVSFIMPNYNHAAFLGAAIESALAQTAPQVEVIVVDDGSTDNSRAVAEAYGARIRYIWQQNQGLSAARNTGVQAARGQYIALLDADDLVEPTYVERLLARLAEDRAEGHDPAGAYCGFRYVDQQNCPLPQVENRLFAPEQLHAALLNGNFWVPESALVLRSCYAAMGEFDVTLRACEDWDVWLRFARAYRLVGTPEVLVRYRVVIGSMSSDPQRMLDNRLAVLRKHVGPQPAGPGDDAAHAAFANAYLRTAIEYWQRQEGATAYAMLSKAAAIMPLLLEEVSTFYELACAEQERGSRGVVAIDEQQAGQQVMATVERLLAEPALQPLARRRNVILAQANLALGMVYYRHGSTTAARSALLRAGRLDPALLRRRDYVALLGKAAVGYPAVAALRRRLKSPVRAA